MKKVSKLQDSTSDSSSKTSTLYLINNKTGNKAEIRSGGKKEGHFGIHLQQAILRLKQQKPEDIRSSVIVS